MPFTLTDISLSASCGNLILPILGSVHLQYVNIAIRDVDSSKNTRRRRLQPHPQASRSSARCLVCRCISNFGNLLPSPDHHIPCNHTPPSVSFELTKLTSNILAIHIRKQKIGSSNATAESARVLHARLSPGSASKFSAAVGLIKTMQPCEESAALRPPVSNYSIPSVISTTISFRQKQSLSPQD